MMIGRTIGDYRIVDKLGAGGMGEVYRAHDSKLDRDVALKVLPPGSFSDRAAHARLLREARAAARLNHPNICTIHDVGEAAGQTYIAMELVEGERLDSLLAREPQPVEQTARYALQLADALAHAHERGVVHRDLKSANVIITPDRRAKVLDFGLAKRLTDVQPGEATLTNASLTQPGAVAGTLAYMAPEQLRGEPADERSDIWALGVVIYEMAAGARPFDGATGFQLSSSILNEEPKPLSEKLPAVLREVITRCLEKDPGRRYRRAGEVRAALEALPSRKTAPRLDMRRLLGRRPWPKLAAAVVSVVVLAALFDVGGVRTRITGAASAAAIESLAVLPFENLSGDRGQDYFAAGITETLITDLARLGGLKRVTARVSAMRYQGTKKPFSEIARELRVDALVTGSVLHSGNRVSIAVQLIDPGSEDQLWTNRYERDQKDVIRLQNEIVSAIVGEIRVKLTPGEQARLASGRPVDPEAYNAYLKGSIESNRLSPKNLETAMEYFRLALREDPAFALGHVGIARVWLIKGHLGYLLPRDAVPEVRAAVSQALALDEGLAEAYRALGSMQFYLEWNWEGALRSWRRAEELEPNDSDVSISRAAYSCALGSLEGTTAAFEKALESDPFNPQLRDFYGHQLLRLRRYDEAVAQFRRVLSTEPVFRSSLNGLWRAFHFKRMFHEALEYAAQYFSAAGYPKVAAELESAGDGRGYAAALRGAAEHLAALSAQSILIARTFAFAGDGDLAQRWLDRAYQDGDSTMVYLKVDPSFDILRGDARFMELLRKMNFPL